MLVYIFVCGLYLFGGHLKMGYQLVVQTLLLPTQPSPLLSASAFKQTNGSQM